MWTDRQKLIVGFGNFVNVPKNSCCMLVTDSPPYTLDNAEYLFLYRSHFYNTGEEVIYNGSLKTIRVTCYLIPYAFL